MARLKTVYLPVRDMARASALYEQALGLSVAFADGERWVQFKTDGGTSVALSAPEETAPGAQNAVPVFEVEDLPQCLSRIVAGGGRLIQERDMGSHGRVAAVEDSEGNIVQLFVKAPETTAP